MALGAYFLFCSLPGPSTHLTHKKSSVNIVSGMTTYASPLFQPFLGRTFTYRVPVLSQVLKERKYTLPPR